MATTTNFGWETPDDTDLVKDGAAAMRTLGNSIDTSFVDLKGGTSGQILSKASNTDLDYTWITNDQGDITAVSAGTGITVTNGTGPIPSVAIDSTVTTLTGTQTLTNKTLTSPVLTTPSISNIDAKGDLLAGTADNTIGRLAVGTNDQVLTADSSTATGLKWATTAASSFPTFSAGASSSTSLPSMTFTKILFDTEDFDTNNNFASSRFTPTVAGYYSLTTSVVTNLPNNSEMELLIYKNGSLWKRVNSSGGTNANSLALAGTAITYLNGSSDYAEVYMYYGAGATGGLYAATNRVFFQGIGIRA
jgi:hypothetical protein